MDQDGQAVGFADGRYLPASELVVPVVDMGFRLSDMCYDAVRVHAGRFFRLDDHLDRWERSLLLRRYTTLGYNRHDVLEILNGCVARAGLRESIVTFVATRGVPVSAHKDLRTCKNRLLVWAEPYYTVSSAEEAETGCDVVISRTIRIPSEAVDPTVKNFCRLDFVGALFEAYDRDAKYAVLLDQDGNVTEGRGWNVFIVKDGVLLTPDRGVLEGITRKTVLELATGLNLDTKVTGVPAEMLRGADEVFMSTSAGGVIPIRSVDGQIIGDGAAGPVTARLRALYGQALEDPRHTTPVNYEASAVT